MGRASVLRCQLARESARKLGEVLDPIEERLNRAAGSEQGGERDALLQQVSRLLPQVRAELERLEHAVGAPSRPDDA